MAKWSLSVWWKDHNPGDVIEADLREIGALVSFGLAKPFVEKKSVKQEEVQDDTAPSSDPAS